MEPGSRENVHRLSHDTVLTLPALALPQKVYNEIAAEQTETSSKENLDSRAATPEMSSPVHEREGTDPRNASAWPLETSESGVTEASHAGPRPQRSICLGDGRVNARKAAVFIMAHMDRLAAAFSAREGRGFPTVGSVKARIDDSDPNRLRNEELGGGVDNKLDKQDQSIYCIDLSPDTFELLSSIISVSQEDNNLDDNTSDDAIPSRPYIILAALRILKANLARLLDSSISSRILASMIDNSVHADFDDANEFRLEGWLGQDPALDTLLFEWPGDAQAKPAVGGFNTALRAGSGINDDVRGKVQEQDDRAGKRSSKGCGGNTSNDAHEIGHYRDVLRTLQQRLLLLVNCGPSRVHAGVVEPVQREAAAVLILGLELFFCNQVEQFRVLSTLMNTAEVNHDDVDSVGGDYDSVDRTVVLGPSAARRYILEPLLDRLCDDELASKLIPYGWVEDNGCSVCTAVEVTEPALDLHGVSVASPRLLDMQASPVA